MRVGRSGEREGIVGRVGDAHRSEKKKGLTYSNPHKKRERCRLEVRIGMTSFGVLAEWSGGHHRGAEELWGGWPAKKKIRG